MSSACKLLILQFQGCVSIKNNLGLNRSNSETRYSGTQLAFQQKLLINPTAPILPSFTNFAQRASAFSMPHWSLSDANNIKSMWLFAGVKLSSPLFSMFLGDRLIFFFFHRPLPLGRTCLAEEFIAYDLLALLPTKKFIVTTPYKVAVSKNAIAHFEAAWSALIALFFCNGVNHKPLDKFHAARADVWVGQMLSVLT